MNYRLPILSLTAILCAVVVVGNLKAEAATKELPPAHQELTISSGGLDRHCLIHLPPAYDKAKPLPLVIMLHGMGGTGANAVREMGWSAKADLETFIVVYPDATRPDPTQVPSIRSNPQAWNDGSGRFHSAERNIDDVAFIRALLDRLAADYSIDRHRIFVAGFSNGASMALRIGAELSDRVAAIAPGAGACWTETVKPTRGISLCYITGTSDTLNPLDGGFPKMAFGGGDKGGKPKPAVRTTVEKWSKALGCPESPTKDETTNGVRTRRYGPGRDGAEIVFITIEGLGHIWAGGVNLVPEFMVGKPTDKLKATDVVWDFFRAHPAP
jgi:polyhydroxybutyrate depolymerase